MSRVGIRPTIASPTLAVFVVLALTAIRSGFAFVHEAPAALSFSFSKSVLESDILSLNPS